MNGNERERPTSGDGRQGSTSRAERFGRAKTLDVLRRRIDTDQARREWVEQHKKAMLADARLSTLSRYVEALGGRLEVRAVFPDGSVELDVGKSRRGSRRAL